MASKPIKIKNPSQGSLIGRMGKLIRSTRKGRAPVAGFMFLKQNKIKILIVACSLTAALFYFKVSSNGDFDKVVRCNELYEIKKEKYWGDKVGQNKVIYNKHLDTCLALNIYYDPYSGDYFSMVIDMANDKTLLYYSTKKGELKDPKTGWDLDDMFKKVREYGFEVFGG